MMEQYGKRHREERQKKKDTLAEQRCEITGKRGKLEAHHDVPRLFNDPNHHSNYTMLQSHFHQKILHAACNVDAPDIVRTRVELIRKLQAQINARQYDAIPGTREQIEDIDEYLIDQYIENMMNNLAHKYRDKVFKVTAVNSFKTIRDLTIEHAIKDTIILEQQAKINELLALIENNHILGEEEYISED